MDAPILDGLVLNHTVEGGRLHEIFGGLTYHGTSTKHLQMYLSEFCYRFNRRSFGGAIFDRLLVAIAG